MAIPSGVLWLAKFSGAGRWLLRLATVASGIGLLISVVDRTRPLEAEVVVHVSEPDVVISVGDRTIPIEGYRDRPIVLSLDPGTYSLSMRRDGRLLFEERLQVGPGDHLVRTAFDPARMERKQVERPYRPNLIASPPRGR